jgi:hypothetical protein
MDLWRHTDYVHLKEALMGTEVVYLVPVWYRLARAKGMRCYAPT